MDNQTTNQPPNKPDILLPEAESKPDSKPIETEKDREINNTEALWLTGC